MNNVDKQYFDLLKDVMNNGVDKETRSGMVRSVFGRSLRFDFKQGFPILTTKKVFTILSGIKISFPAISTNISKYITPFPILCVIFFLPK